MDKGNALCPVCLIFQDGFYTGELVDGQRGLVPSNFVEKIAGTETFL